MIRTLAEELGLKWESGTDYMVDRVCRRLLARPRDIHIEGAHHLNRVAIETLRYLWDMTGSEGDAKTIRIVLRAAPGFIDRITAKHPEFADRARFP